jgi:hypothetical protein
VPTHKLTIRRPLSAVTRRKAPRKAVANQRTPAPSDPTGSISSTLVVVEQATARRWAQADASEYARMRSVQSRLNAVEAIAGHMWASPAYAAALTQHAPALAAQGKAVHDEWLALREAAVKALRRELAHVQ